MYMSKENKIKQLQEQFFQLLRLSMGLTEQKDFEAAEEFHGSISLSEADKRDAMK